MTHRIGQGKDGIKSKYVTRTTPFDWQLNWISLKRGDFVEIGWLEKGGKHKLVVCVESYNFATKKLYFSRVVLWDYHGCRETSDPRFAKMSKERIVTRSWMKMRVLSEKEVIAYAL